jgi:hypothetical protein
MPMALTIVKLLNEAAFVLEISVPNVNVKFDGGAIIKIEDIIYKHENVRILFTNNIASHIVEIMRRKICGNEGHYDDDNSGKENSAEQTNAEP